METSLDRPLTIQIAGLGGQGVVLAGDILAEAALISDFNVKKSEIHGLSRRFGSVSCQIRIGRELHSPLRGHGGVDLLLALEGYEGLKHLPFMTRDGRGLFNRMWRKPGAVIEADDTPPETCDDLRISWFDGTDLTRAANCTRSLNYFMLGVLGTRLPISQSAWDEAINGITTKGLSTNLEMFNMGRRYGLIDGTRYRNLFASPNYSVEIAS